MIPNERRVLQRHFWKAFLFCWVEKYFIFIKWECQLFSWLPSCIHMTLQLKSGGAAHYTLGKCKSNKRFTDRLEGLASEWNVPQKLCASMLDLVNQIIRDVRIQELASALCPHIHGGSLMYCDHKTLLYHKPPEFYQQRFFGPQGLGLPAVLTKITLGFGELKVVMEQKCRDKLRHFHPADIYTNS
jgi:hypothetical protein